MLDRNRALARNVSELIEKWLRGSLSGAEADELRELCLTNELAKEELIHRAGIAKRDPMTLLGETEHPANTGAALADESLEIDQGTPIPPAKPTPVWVRMVSVAILVIIVFSLFFMPFMRIKASLLKLVDGQMLTAMGNPTPTVEDPAEVSIPQGQETRLLIRGGSYLTTTGPTKLRATEKGPAARIELLEGQIKVERPTLKRECFIASGGLEIEPSIEGGALTMSYANGEVVAEVTDGKAVIYWQGKPLESISGDVRIITGDGPTDVIRLEVPEMRPGVVGTGTRITIVRGVLTVTPPEGE